MKKYLFLFIIILLASCGTNNESFPMMGGEDSGMMARHHAQVPEDYAGKTAPKADDESLARGAATYTQSCESCHGADGMGTGPVAKTLNPAPAQIAHTSQMLADDLLLYRISEGGVEFQTAMPAWKGVLTEEQIWDVVGYIRALGQGNAEAIHTARAAQQDAMLKNAVEKKVITEAQAETFRTVHDALEGYMKTNAPQGNMSEREAAVLSTLVKNGKLTQTQVDEFTRVHGLLGQNGLMP